MDNDTLQEKIKDTPYEAKLYYQLVGYFSQVHHTNVHKAAEDDARKMTAFLLEETDNPFFWLMQIQITRGMSCDEIIAVIRRQEILGGREC